MARIKLGPIVTDISGSVGGATFQRNPSGIIMRSKPLPLNPATADQFGIRWKLRYLQNSWAALTDAQRLQWQRFIDFSNQKIRRDKSITMSGYNLYLKYQLMRLLNLKPLLTTISFVPIPQFPRLEDISNDHTIYNLEFSDTIDSTKLFFVLKLGYPRPVQMKYNSRGIRFIQAPWGSADHYNIAAPYYGKFGFLPPDDTWLSYAIQYFSYLSPCFSGTFTGVLECIYEP